MLLRPVRDQRAGAAPYDAPQRVFPCVRRGAAALTVVAALGLPGGAQADVHASASAAAKAGVRANVDLRSAAELADHLDSASRARARALQSRSRAELKLAVAKTRKLAAAADSSRQIRVGARALTRISAALSRDAALQAKIAISAEGRLESQAAAALVSDVRMQQAIITAGLKMAGDASAKTLDVALQSSAKAIQRLIAEVEAAAEVAAASSADVSAEARASAKLAVGLAAKTLSSTTTMLSAIVDGIELEAQGASRAAVEMTLEVLTDAGAQIAGTVQQDGIAADEVTLAGVGEITLGTLSQLAADLTSSASLSAGTKDMTVRFGAAGQAALAVLGH